MSWRSAPVRICKPCWTAAHWPISITRMPLLLTKHWFIPLAVQPPCPIKANPIPLKLIMLNCVTTWLGSLGVLAVFPVPFTLFGARLNSLSLPGAVANSLNMNSQKCSLMSAILYTLDRCHSQLLGNYGKLSAPDAVVLIRAARLYQDALW